MSRPGYVTANYIFRRLIAFINSFIRKTIFTSALKNYANGLGCYVHTRTNSGLS